MTIPTYDHFIAPVLRFLAGQTDPVPAKDGHEAAADALCLDAEQRAELLPSGLQAVYKNRAGWAHDRLKRAGLSTSPRRGYWQLTDAGRSHVKEKPSPLPQDEIQRLTLINNQSSPYFGNSASGRTEPAIVLETGSPAESPEERLESAVAEMTDSVQGELLENIMQNSPLFFEQLVLDVLHKMGYGLSRKDIQRVGKSNDGGIDGVISLDRLGLEKVYVQAKRWQNTVGRPEIQGFYGALAGSARARASSSRPLTLVSRR